MRNLLIALVFTLLPTTVAAESPETKGLKIVQEADRRDTGWVDLKAELKMVLKKITHF